MNHSIYEVKLFNIVPERTMQDFFFSPKFIKNDSEKTFLESIYRLRMNKVKSFLKIPNRSVLYLFSIFFFSVH